MGAELGATTSVFPFDERMATYLRATRPRASSPTSPSACRDLLAADPEVEQRPRASSTTTSSRSTSSTLEPHLVGPHTPDLARPISQLAADGRRRRATRTRSPRRSSAPAPTPPTRTSTRAADVARAGAGHGPQGAAPLLDHAGLRDQIHATIERDGQMAALDAVGATVLANACGPCIGQWKRDDIKKGDKNTIVTSFNRNFPARNDGNPETLAFIASPEIVTAYGLAGRLDFNPLHRHADRGAGRQGLHASRRRTGARAARRRASSVDADGPRRARRPTAASVKVQRAIRTAKRLQLLEPFAAWDGKD